MFSGLRRYLADMLFLLGSERRKLPWLLAGFLLVALMDVFGLATVGAYIVFLTQSEESAPPILAVLTAVLPREPSAVTKITVGGLLVGFFVTKAVVAVFINRQIFRFAYSQLTRLRSQLSNGVLGMPYEAFSRRNSSEFIQAMLGYVPSFVVSLTTLLRLTAEGVVAIAIVVMLLVVNTTSILLLVTLGLILLVGYDRLSARRLRRAGCVFNQSSQQMIKGIQETVFGLKEIRILGCGPFFTSKVENNSRQVAESQAFIGLMGTIPRYIVEAAIIGFVVTFAGILLAWGEKPELMYPVIGLIGMAALRLGPATGMVLQSVAALRGARPAIGALRRELAGLAMSPNSVDQKSVASEAADFQSLELEDVIFSYHGSSEPAINEVSLIINKGDVVGFIGSSGAGKTTLIDVILGLLDYQSGVVRYNGHPLADQRQQWWSKVAYLPQEIFLVDASLRENVALGTLPEQIDDHRVAAALSQAQLHSLVASWKNGAKSPVGEKGARLSGGQRQRIALARALYHQREVLVMDEATSALDSETEREIIEEIARLKGEKTMIVIAHRLTTLQYCDRIYRLEQGRIVEISSYAEAVTRNEKLT
jgi:ATP-binding cassette, subfamily B, bacterial PglK